MAPPQPATPVFSVSGPELLLIECPYNRAFDDAIHDDRTTVIQPDQMCRTPPNQVADHGIIPIAHPRVRSGYGRGHASNKFVRIGLGQRFPIWFPMQTVEFYARQVKCGSNARGHGRLAGTRGPNHHDAHLISRSLVRVGMFNPASRSREVSLGRPARIRATSKRRAARARSAWR